MRDPFKVGDDIDAVSRASLTMLRATRAIRNAENGIALQVMRERSGELDRVGQSHSGHSARRRR